MVVSVVLCSSDGGVGGWQRVKLVLRSRSMHARNINGQNEKRPGIKLTKVGIYFVHGHVNRRTNDLSVCLSLSYMCVDGREDRRCTNSLNSH